jgi:hypothetical protein
VLLFVFTAEDPVVVMSCIKYKSGQWTYDDSHPLSQTSCPN